MSSGSTDWPEPMSVREVSTELDCSEEEVRAQQVAWNTPPPLVEARLSIFRAIREGRLAKVTDTVTRVLRRKPIAFDQWVKENAAFFL